VKRPPRWVDKRALLLLHQESLASFGGGRGIRDEGLLDSALARPVNKFLYERVDDMAELAAAYGFGIARNHPFVDGNKRAAYVAIGLFLSINGRRLAPDQLDAIHTIVALAAGAVDEAALAAWIRANIVARPTRTAPT
jgi:death on curing protein